MLAIKAASAKVFGKEVGDAGVDLILSIEETRPWSSLSHLSKFLDSFMVFPWLFLPIFGVGVVAKAESWSESKTKSGSSLVLLCLEIRTLSSTKTRFKLKSVRNKPEFWLRRGLESLVVG